MKKKSYDKLPSAIDRTQKIHQIEIFPWSHWFCDYRVQ